ncbi:right-handed parallel beta-helix repeat-containing protein, partial [Patescibacteria group bacterium]
MKLLYVRLIFTGILFLIFSFFTKPVLAATYYVSPTGSGTVCTSSNPCSLSQPSLSAGDTLYLKGGTYTRGTKLNFTSSGTATSRITISSAPGEDAVISGDVNGNNVVDEVDGPRVNGADKWTPLVLLSGNNILFKDIEVKFSGGRGLQSIGEDNTFSGNNVHHIWNIGIFIHGLNNIVDGNTVWRTAESNFCDGVGGSRACNGNWPGGIAWGSVDAFGPPGRAPNTIIRNNTVYHVSGEGIICMQTDGGLVENNIVYDNWAEGIYLDQCSFTTIQKNLSYYTSDKAWWRFSNGNQPADPFLTSNEAINGYPVNGHDIKVLNNVFIDGRWGFGFWEGFLSGSHLENVDIENNTIISSFGNGMSIFIDSGNHKNVNIKNNIIYQTSGTPASVSGGGVTFFHNLWYPLNGITGVGDIRQDSKF